MRRPGDVSALPSGSIIAFGAESGRRALALASTTLVMCTAAGALAAAPGTAVAAKPIGHAARTISLSENGQLKLTSKSGFTLNERGSATGTITGSIYIHLHLISNSKVTAEVSIFPHNSSLSGMGSASYHVNGSIASFSGTLAITRGTGKYSHARASRLTFTGTIQRRNDAVAVRLSGPLSA